MRKTKIRRQVAKYLEAEPDATNEKVAKTLDLPARTVAGMAVSLRGDQKSYRLQLLLEKQLLLGIKPNLSNSANTVGLAFASSAHRELLQELQAEYQEHGGTEWES